MKRIPLPIAALLATLAALLIPNALTAQVTRFEPWDSSMIAVARHALSDSIDAGDLALIAVEAYGFSPDTGLSNYARYFFYSSSTRMVAAAAMMKWGGTQPRINSYRWYPLLEGEPEPEPLDTAGLDLRSTVFAAAIRGSAEYQAYRASQSYAPGTVLRMPRSVQTFPWLPDSSLSGPLWLMAHPPLLDSSMVLAYQPRVAVLAVDMQKSLDVISQSRYSARADAAFATTNDGRFAYNLFRGTGYFETPRGGGVGYLAGAGLWVGARTMVDGALTPRVFVTFQPYDGESWATPGEAMIARPELPRPIGYVSSSHDSLNGAPLGNEPYPWGMWSRSSDPASPMHPGEFVPRLENRMAGGSYVAPAFVAGSVEQFASRYHDMGRSRYAPSAERTGFPLGLQFQENVYAQPDGLAGTVIIRYAIVNVSRDTLFDVVAAPIVDYDLDDPSNDAASFYEARPELRSAIAGSLPDKSRQQVLMTLIEAPTPGEGGRVDNSDRNAYRTEGRVETFRAWLMSADPKGSAERYALLRSGRRDVNVGPGDHRAILAGAPVTLLPGDTAYVAVGYSIHAGAPGAVDSNAARMIRYYFRQPSASVEPRRPSGVVARLTPNPATDRLDVHLAVPASAGALISIIDALGRLRLGSHLEVGSLHASVDTRTLPAGRYSLIITDGGRARALPLIIAR